MLAVGHRVHQSRMVASSVVAFLTPLVVIGTFVPGGTGRYASP